MDVKETAILSVLGITSELNGLSLESVYKNLSRIKELASVLEKQEKKLRDVAFTMAEESGQKDDKGSYLVKLADGTWFKKEARTSVSLKQEEAVTLLKDRGLDKYLTPDLSQVDPLLAFAALKKHNPQAAEDVKFKVENTDLEQAYYNGHITDEELQSLVERQITYALKLKK